METVTPSEWGEKVARALRNINPERVRIAGSAVINPRLAADVDVFTDCEDTFSRLLFVSHGTSLHPTLLRRTKLEELPDVLSFSNCAKVAKVNGEIVYGSRFTGSNVLQFNPQSIREFSDIRHVIKIGCKMATRGFVLPPATVARAWIHLGSGLTRLAALANLVKETIGSEIHELLAQHRAIVAGGFLRDELMGKAPKDLDIFVVGENHWEKLCAALLSLQLTEIKFDTPPGKRVNLRKFRAADGTVLDVINYGFVHQTQHVVDTFDFTVNMLWYDPLTQLVRGSSTYEAALICRDISERRLVVGDNLWYRAGKGRALKRWQRFRDEGFVPESSEVIKYSTYVRQFL